MSDKNLSDKKFDAIPKDASINIEVTGQFYQSVKSVFSEMLIENETKDSIATILENLGSNKITSLKEHRLYNMFILLSEIEFKAREQKVIVKMSFEESKNA